MKAFNMKYQTRISLVIATLFVSGCTIWPDYLKPTVPVPASYKESTNFPGWKVAEPRDHQAGGAWWSVFEDAQLSTLIDEATKANYNIAQAEAHYRQTEALSRVTRAGLFPSLNGNASAKREQTGNANTQSSYAVGLNAAWEADLWGKIKRGIESGDANLSASAADLNSAILSVQATLAQNYFQLRILDTQKKLLDETAVAYERSLTLTNNRYKVGLASRTEIAQAEAQLRTTLAQAIDTSGQRAQLEHAIAVLTGHTPAEFSLAVSPLENTALFKLPDTPASLPSELLERRPDIAAAERRTAAANAQIGVTKAAFYPSLNLVGNLGFQSSSLSNLLTLPSRVWSLGPLLAISIFDGGQRKGQTDASIAAYDAAVSVYKQTVLDGFQEVEDDLALLRTLEEEAKEQEAAVRFAKESLQQTENRYKAGTVDYLSVVIVQSTALTAERNALSILGRRLNANIGLIKALGGSVSKA
jgi:NodT family efflux transporter outer membrane factor (OMF) lipoprotein